MPDLIKCIEESRYGLCGDGMCVMPHFNCKLYKPEEKEMKKQKCSKCKKKLPADLEHFGPSNRSKNGRTMKCLSCMGGGSKVVKQQSQKKSSPVQVEAIPGVLESRTNGDTHIHIHVHTLDVESLAGLIDSGRRQAI